MRSSAKPSTVMPIDLWVSIIGLTMPSANPCRLMVQTSARLPMTKTAITQCSSMAVLV